MEGCLTKNAIFILLAISTASAHADSVNNEWLSTTRSLSMGNVGIASAEDPSTAMFYNPAALARSKKTTIEVFNPQFEFGTGVLSLSKGEGDYGKHFGLEKVKPLLDKKPNTPSYLGMSLYPNLYAQNFNFGILLRGEAVSYSEGEGGSLTYKSRYLVIPTFALSVGALGGRFKLGIAVRGIQITENDVTTTDFTRIGYLNDPAEGFGLGMDAGALFSLPWAGLPTFGLTARNVGDTRFTGSAPLSLGQGIIRQHDKIKMTFDSGFAVFPKIGQRSVLTLAVDYRDMTDVNEVDLKRRLNLGMELAFNKTFYLRAGLSRGYWTAGLGLASKAGSIDLGTYAEELDARGWRVLDDRRISLRYGARF